MANIAVLRFGMKFVSIRWMLLMCAQYNASSMLSVKVVLSILKFIGGFGLVVG